jgi:hypothetical protein
MAYFIQKALKEGYHHRAKNRGVLRRIAAREGAITQRGTISKTWLNANKHAPGKFGMRVRLAITLGKIRRRR